MTMIMLPLPPRIHPLCLALCLLTTVAGPGCVFGFDTTVPEGSVVDPDVTDGGDAVAADATDASDDDVLTDTDAAAIDADTVEPDTDAAPEPAQKRKTAA